jgi:hypothetical protein
MKSHVVVPVRLAALVALASGLIGGGVWFVDLADRGDGDALRWGFWHNPWMAFEPFHEAYLDASMWALLACSAAAALGGVAMLAGKAFGVRLLAWQAPVAIATNLVVVVGIALMAFGVLAMDWTGTALALRVGSILVDLALWRFVRSRTVSEWIGGLHGSRATGRRG